MFAHITSIRTPLGGMNAFRELIMVYFLPLVQAQPGFLREYFLVQVDDPDRAQLVLVWDSQDLYEQFRGSPAAGEAIEALRVACLRFESQGYIART